MVKHEHKWNDSLTVIEVTDKGMRRATNQDSSVVVLQSDEESYQQRGIYLSFAMEWELTLPVN